MQVDQDRVCCALLVTSNVNAAEAPPEVVDARRGCRAVRLCGASARAGGARALGRRCARRSASANRNAHRRDDEVLALAALEGSDGAARRSVRCRSSRRSWPGRTRV